MEKMAASGKSTGEVGDKDDNKKKSYTPFPPAQTPSKIDLQLDSGEYFLSDRQRKARKMAEKRMKSIEKKEEKRIEREKVYEAPSSRKKVDRDDEDNSINVARGSSSSAVNDLDLDGLKKKFAKATKRKADGDLADFVDHSSKKKKKKSKK